MTAFCPACLAEQPVDTLLACTGDNRARIFCAVCGHFHGYDERDGIGVQALLDPEPEPVTEAPPVFLAPIAGPTSLVDALWKYAGRLAGGVW